MKRTDFGLGPGGAPVELFTLDSGNGLVARITNYGGIITELHAPDRDGKSADVVLGFDSIQPYLAGHPCFGAIVGRVAGRITHGSFSVGGVKYSLPINENTHHLHGGFVGFDKRVWTPEVVNLPRGEALQLKYHSPDGEEGYPGNVDATVTYSVTPDNALHIAYKSTSDQPTPLSLTNHSYFNLGGESSGDFGTHELQVYADEYTPVNADFSQTGRRSPVDGPNDFRAPAAIGPRLKDFHAGHGEQFMVRRDAPGLVLAARVSHPESGRTMEVLTTEACIQFYTGVFLDGSLTGKGGKPYGKFAGLCLECQGYPDAPNHPGFDSIFLYPGGIYRQKTIYRFVRPTA